MIESGWLGGHPESGALLCYADRSLSAPEHERLAVHLTECEYCQRELSHIESQARIVSAAMASVAVEPVNDIRKAQAWAAVKSAARKVEQKRRLRNVIVPRLAAASMVIVVGALAAGPGLALMRTVFGGGSSEPQAVSPTLVNIPAVPSNDAGSNMNWNWRSSTANFVFRNRQSGTVQFARSVDNSVEVQVIGASEVSGVGRRPDGDVIEIQNDATTSPIYVISLPARVTQVTFSMAGSKQFSATPKLGIRYDVNGLASGQLIPLSGSK